MVAKFINNNVEQILFLGFWALLEQLQNQLQYTLPDKGEGILQLGLQYLDELVEAVLEVVAVVVLDQGLLRELRFLRDQFEEREGLETFEGDLNENILIGVNSSEILPLALILAHGHQILQSL